MVSQQKIMDPDVEELASVATTLRSDYQNRADDWRESPFSWIRSCPSRQRGKIGESLVARLLEARGLATGPSGDSDADLTVNGRRVEIKFSTLWAGGFYKFQQIRDQKYDFLICLGISPFDAHSWVFTKGFLLEGWGNLPGFMSQHGGRAGSDTAWIQIDPAAPESWLAQHGGTLRSAFNVLSELLNERT